LSEGRTFEALGGVGHRREVREGQVQRLECDGPLGGVRGGQKGEKEAGAGHVERRGQILEAEDVQGLPQTLAATGLPVPALTEGEEGVARRSHEAASDAQGAAWMAEEVHALQARLG